MTTPPELLARASASRDAGEAEEAVQWALQAADALESAGELVSAGRARRLAADCLAELDRHPQALAELKRARRAFVADDAAGVDAAGSEVAAARSLRALGRREDARGALHRAQVTFARCGMPVRAAICRLDLGVLAHDEGDVDSALALLTEARTTFLEHRRPDLAAVGDFDLGVALLDSGHPDDAIERFVGARGIFESLARPADEAACDLNMGVALEAVGRRDEARQALRRARDAFRALGRDRDVEQAEHDLDVVDGLVDPDTAELSVLRSLGEVDEDLGASAEEADQVTGGMTTDSA